MVSQCLMRGWRDQEKGREGKGRDGQWAGRWAQHEQDSVNCSLTPPKKISTPMLVQVLLKGTLPRQYERLNCHCKLVDYPGTLRVRSSCVRPLYMRTEPDVNVYAKSENALQTAKALLSKVCSL